MILNDAHTSIFRSAAMVMAAVFAFVLSPVPAYAQAAEEEGGESAGSFSGFSQPYDSTAGMSDSGALLDPTTEVNFDSPIEGHVIETGQVNDFVTTFQEQNSNAFAYNAQKSFYNDGDVSEGDVIFESMDFGASPTVGYTVTVESALKGYSSEQSFDDYIAQTYGGH